MPRARTTPWRRPRWSTRRAAEKRRTWSGGALGRLDLPMRTILVLRYFAEFDSKEIAKILDMPDSTVRSHLRTGRQQLALELKRAGYQHD